MRALPLAAALAVLSGCIVAGPRPYAVQPAPVVVPAGISQDQAVDVAFRAARDRGLDVDRVHHLNRDSSGRWHVDLRGRRDKAKVLVDARDGRVLKMDSKDR